MADFNSIHTGSQIDAAVTAALGGQFATPAQVAAKQDTLVSGANIKTVNSQSLLGAGNVNIQGGIEEAPDDGKLYGRKNEDWEEVPQGGAGDVADVTVDGNSVVDPVTKIAEIDLSDIISKLAGISDGANKVEASLTRGNIKIDGAETPVFEFTNEEASALTSVMNNKGIFTDDTALIAAFGTPELGWYATVLSTGTVWTVVDSGGGVLVWEDSGVGGSVESVNGQTGIVVIGAATSLADGLMSSADKAALDGHIADGDIHVTAQDKTDWNGKLDGITAPVGEVLIEVDDTDPLNPIVKSAVALQTAVTNANTAYQKPSGGITAGDLAQGVQDSLELADSALQAGDLSSLNGRVTDAEDDISDLQTGLSNTVARVASLENLGQFAGSFDNFATAQAAGNTTMPTNISGFADITVNDFATVRADETNGGAVTRYIASAIDGVTGDITWIYDITYSTDATGKMDLVSGADGGNLLAVDTNGQAVDSGKALSDFAAAAQGAKADTALQAADIDATPTQSSANIVSSGGVFAWFGAAVSTLATTAKTVVGAINELFAGKQDNIPAGTAGYLATHSGTAGTFGTAVDPATLATQTDLANAQMQVMTPNMAARQMIPNYSTITQAGFVWAFIGEGYNGSIQLQINAMTVASASNNSTSGSSDYGCMAAVKAGDVVNGWGSSNTPQLYFVPPLAIAAPSGLPYISTGLSLNDPEAQFVGAPVITATPLADGQTKYDIFAAGIAPFPHAAGSNPFLFAIFGLDVTNVVALLTIDGIGSYPVLFTPSGRIDTPVLIPANTRYAIQSAFIK